MRPSLLVAMMSQPGEWDVRIRGRIVAAANGDRQWLHMDEQLLPPAHDSDLESGRTPSASGAGVMPEYDGWGWTCVWHVT